MSKPKVTSKFQVFVERLETTDHEQLQFIKDKIEEARIYFGNRKNNLSDKQNNNQIAFINKWNNNRISFAFLCNDEETIEAYNNFKMQTKQNPINYKSIIQF